MAGYPGLQRKSGNWQLAYRRGKIGTRHPFLVPPGAGDWNGLGEPDELMAGGQLEVEITAAQKVNMGYNRRGKHTEPRWVLWYVLHFDNDIDKEQKVQIWEEHTTLFDNAGWEFDWHAMNERMEFNPPIWVKLSGGGKLVEVMDNPARHRTKQAELIPPGSREGNEIRYE
jgi:hypothetical protein